MEITPHERKQARFYLTLQCLLMFSLGVAPFVDNWQFRPFHPALHFWGGGVVFLLGWAVLTIGFFNLKKAATMHPVPREAGELSTSGLYRYARHPIYVAGFLITIGWILLFTTPLTILVGIGIFWTLNQKATLEEKFLERKFGTSYSDYRRRVGKFGFRSR